MQEFVVIGLVLILGLGAYWSLVIFPRQRDFQKQQRYVRSMKTGDEMITFGGIIGRVTEIDADKGIAYLEIADGVTIKVLTAALMRPYNPEEFIESAQLSHEEEAK
jgi:preprotein translocase subunit YajC